MAELTEGENIFKVQLRSAIVTAERVTFDVTPDVIENRNVNYKSIDPVHMPGSIQAYGSTSSRTFNISNAKLVSRTREEATRNIKFLWLLRGWTMPRFGTSSSTLTDSNRLDRRTEQQTVSDLQQAGRFADLTSFYGKETLGSPPDVLILDAYSDVTRAAGDKTFPMNIHRVPVVIQQLSIPYPSDVDYIQTLHGVPFPTMMSVDLTLIEAQAPADLNRFSLNDYKNGTLGGF